MNRKFRTILAFLTRLFFRVPFVIFANISYGLSALFENIGDGLNHCQKLLKPISNAPFIFDWKEQLEGMEEKQKRKILRMLNNEYDI